MINIISNIWYALLALLVLTIILHFFLVYRKNLSKKQWKRIDYLWISLTAIGLIGATNNVKTTLSKYQISSMSDRIPSSYKFAISFLHPEGSTVVCRDFVRNELSPANFDSIVADYTRSCEWSKQVYKVVAAADTVKYELIDTTKIPLLETNDNKWFKGVVLENIREYNQLVIDREKSKMQLNVDSADNLLFFTPIFLILGLAIRITKVTGELKHEK